MSESEVLDELFQVIEDRISNPKPGSYVTSLVNDPKGIDKVLEKVGEEATEFIIAMKNGIPARTVEEAADLQFHLLIALRMAGIDLSDLMAELKNAGDRALLKARKSIFFASFSLPCKKISTHVFFYQLRE